MGLGTCRGRLVKKSSTSEPEEDSLETRRGSARRRAAGVELQRRRAEESAEGSKRVLKEGDSVFEGRGGRSTKVRSSRRRDLPGERQRCPPLLLSRSSSMRSRFPAEMHVQSAASDPSDPEHPNRKPLMPRLFASSHPSRHQTRRVQSR